MAFETPRYKYFLVNIVDNQPLAEVPFKSVSYARALKGAGSFSGEIAITAETEHLELYETTMPGRSAIYVMRNDEVVWGGIIWTRSYNVNGRVLSVNASEFTSYFYHRRIWKTWGQDFSATVVSSGGNLSVTLDLGSTYGIEVGSTVRIIFYEVENFQYNGYYVVTSYNPETFTFTTSAQAKNSTIEVPAKTYFFATIYIRTNTYDYLRSLLNAVAQDFTGISFANTEIEPAKRITHNVINKQITGGVARITFDEPHQLVPGQQIDVKDVDLLLDGLQTVTGTSDNLITISDFGGNVASTAMSVRDLLLTSRQLFGNVATVTTNIAHELYVGQNVSISGLDPAGTPVPLLDGTYKVSNIQNDTTFSYNVNGQSTLLFRPLTPPTATSTTNVSNFQYLTRELIESINATASNATLTTGRVHSFNVSDTINIAGIFDFSTIINRSLVNNVITFTTDSPHGYSVGELVTTTGLADITSIINRGLNVNTTTNVATFEVETATAHNLQIANAITISGALDYERISSYSYTPGTNTLTLNLGNHNFDINVGKSLTVRNIDPVPTKIDAISSNGTRVNVTTNSAHGLRNNESIVITNLAPTVTFEIDRLSRRNGRATARVVTVANANPGIIRGDRINVVVSGATPTNFNANNVNVLSTSSSNNVYTFTYTSSGTDTGKFGTRTIRLDVLESYSWRENVGRVSSNSTSNNVFTNYIYNGPTVVGPAANTTWMRSALRFDRFEPSDNDEENIDITNATLTITRAPGLGNSTSTVYLGLHGDTNLADTGSQNNAPQSIVNVLATANVPVNATVTITLPSQWYPYIANGAARGILFGITGHPNTWNEESTEEELIWFYGRGRSGSSLPTGWKPPSVQVTYDYTEGANVIIGTNVANVTKTFTNLNGNFTTENVVNSTFFSYRINTSQWTSGYNALGGTFNTINISGYAITANVAPRVSPFNGTYANTLLTRNATSISINVPGISKTFTDVAIPSTRFNSNTPPRVEMDSIFNGQQIVTAVTSSSRVQFQRSVNVANIIVANVTFGKGTGTPPLGSGIILSTEFNRTNATITTVTPNTFSIAYSSAKTIPAATNAISPTGIAAVSSVINGNNLTVVSKTNTTFTVTLTGLTSQTAKESTPIYGYANSLTEPKVTYGTYGPYAFSSDIDLEFSTTDYSNNDVLPPFFRGFEVLNVGEELDKYSDIVDGFDYRIDCSIDPDTGEFKRTFVLIPVMPTAVKNYIDDQPNGVLPSGEVVPIEYYGADRIIFEFPGNIADLQLEESAENAATRFFMVGNIGDLGDDASQPYAAAISSSLLNPPEGAYRWPLLDEDEAAEDIDDEDKLYQYAERYLVESKPPIGRFTVSVNGSVEPIIGTYAPGDWCSLIINDRFIGQRLASDLEPRSTVLLRRINGFSVKVPDSITYPEEITLDLIPEWQVDKVG